MRCLKSFKTTSSALLSAADAAKDAGDSRIQELAKTGNKLAQLAAYIDEYIFSYLVPFTSALKDCHQRHIYMEREWRVLGDVRFSLTDVERIILPRDYANHLRADLPDYCGQVSYPC